MLYAIENIKRALNVALAAKKHDIFFHAGVMVDNGFQIGVEFRQCPCNAAAPRGFWLAARSR
jgi:hypothetical protein